jgi:iron complex transport system substrate-binding protein
VTRRSTIRRSLESAGVLLCALALASSCGRIDEPQGSANLQRGCIQSFEEAKDYFPKKALIEAATNFSVEYRRSYKVVTVRAAAYGGGPETYILLQCGAPRPQLEESLAAAPVIPVPIVSLFSESTTHDQPLIDLGRVDVLTGVTSVYYAIHEEIRERIRAGKIVDFAPGGIINTERVIASAPSVFMASRNDDPSFAALRNGGVPVVANAEWLENSPLGRAEWIKFIALFLNEEEKADGHFKAVLEAYRSWLQRTARIPKTARPRVTTGSVLRGGYIVAGGRSYVSALIADAGADYVWSDNELTGSSMIDIESAIARGASADYWINGGSWTSLAEMLADEPRYREFKAYRSGQVWLYNRRALADGSNEYWSRGIARPDLILADLVKIFHPDLAADHEFQWYLRVPEKRQ